MIIINGRIHFYEFIQEYIFMSLSKTKCDIEFS